MEDLPASGEDDGTVATGSPVPAQLPIIQAQPVEPDLIVSAYAVAPDPPQGQQGSHLMIPVIDAQAVDDVNVGDVACATPFSAPPAPESSNGSIPSSSMTEAFKWTKSTIRHRAKKATKVIGKKVVTASEVATTGLAISQKAMKATKEISKGLTKVSNLVAGPCDSSPSTTTYSARAVTNYKDPKTGETMSMTRELQFPSPINAVGPSPTPLEQTSAPGNDSQGCSRSRSSSGSFEEVPEGATTKSEVPTVTFMSRQTKPDRPVYSKVLVTSTTTSTSILFGTTTTKTVCEYRRPPGASPVGWLY